MAKKKTSSKKKAWRFFRSNLSTKVWDAENHKLLADFSTGTFTTTEERVAMRLIEEGYPEISLDAEEPPELIIRQPTMVIDGDVPVLGKGVSPGLGEATIATKMRKTGGPKPPEVIERLQ
jgi:hypothetical protein